MARYGMVIDLNRCVGCQACAVACKVENNVRFSTPEEATDGREIHWMEVLPVSVGEFPDVVETYMPVLCNHCDNPACVPVCPTGATYQSKPTGIIGQVYTRCIGCRYCAVACPYMARYFNWSKPHWPEEMRARLNPDVSVRTKSVIEKCTFCSHRLPRAKEAARAKGRKLRDGDYVSACMEACPTRAITFGDLDDRNSRVAVLSRSRRATRLREELGTEPKVFYLEQDGGWDVNYNDG